MAFETINPNRFDVDSPCSTDLFASIVGDLNFLNSANTSSIDAGGAPLVLNGSFELPLIATSTTPNDWDLNPGTGGAIATINTDQIHGAQSLQFTRDSTAGHSGGTATSSDFFNVSPYLWLYFIFMMKSSRSDVSNTVVINWYASDQSALSSTTMYSDTSAPTDWTDFRRRAQPPTSARFGKIILSGGTSTTTPGATANILFDGLSMSLKPPFIEQASYTSTTSFTCGVPSTGFGSPGPWKIKMWGKYIPGGSGSNAGGGYLEAIVFMRYGDTATLTVNATGTTTFVLNGRDGTTTLSCGATTGAGATPGIATGGNVNLPGNSRYATGFIASIEF